MSNYAPSTQQLPTTAQENERAAGVLRSTNQSPLYTQELYVVR